MRDTRERVGDLEERVLDLQFEMKNDEKELIARLITNKNLILLKLN